MNIYKTSFNYDSFLSLDINLKDMMFAIGEHIGTKNFLSYSSQNLSLLEYWKDDFKANFVAVDGLPEASGRPDITAWNKANFVMSEAAYEVLKLHLAEYGEFLPINIDDKPYYIFNCLNAVEVDSSSELDLSPRGGFLGVKKIGFTNEVVENNLVFKSKFDRGSAIYCGDKFKSLLEDNNLKGLNFNTDLLSCF
jgi:hypothetical protein